MHPCPACGAADARLVDTQRNIPVNSCLLLYTQDAAQSFPTGDLALSICHACGFVFNALFDSSKSEYSARYEESQGYSPRFNEFARALATRWVEDHDLAGRTVLEIGCGSMGEFLQLMVDAGVGRAIGVDPALEPDRITAPEPDRFEWMPEFYPVPGVTDEVDAIVCRHTLEHIAPVGEFVRSLRRTIGDRTDIVVLFELPDVQRVLDECAYWDVYYEHCSYFSVGSLVRLFRSAGFDPFRVGYEYDDQYIVIEARPAAGPVDEAHPEEDDLSRLLTAADRYRHTVAATRDHWRDRVGRLTDDGKRVVIWGAGSKGVSFLTGLRDGDIRFAVDINPTKHGCFMAGTGQEVVAPDFLASYRPDLVVAMNPIYLDEIRADLDRLGVDAELVAV